MDQLLLFLLRVGEILIRFYEIVLWQDDAGPLLYYFMLLKVTGKVSLDRNTMYNPIIHHIYNYYYR